jgi:SAM-dependent methyltransferase
MDATDLQFKGGSFDTVFVCFMLEHTKKPIKVLQEALRVLKPNGRIVITEVMNFTFFLDPYSPNVSKYWMAFNDYQYENTGDPFVGVKLGQLLKTAGYVDIQTNALNTHIDGRDPKLRHQVLEDWQGLLDSSADRLIEAGYVTQDLRKEMNAGFERAKQNDHAIVYDSIMQAKAYKAK